MCDRTGTACLPLYASTFRKPTATSIHNAYDAGFRSVFEVSRTRADVARLVAIGNVWYMISGALPSLFSRP